MLKRYYIIIQKLKDYTYKKAVQVERLYYCSNCGYKGLLHIHSRYERNLVTKNETRKIEITRHKCPMCDKTYSVHPENVIPYRQLSFGFIMKILNLAFCSGYNNSSIERFFNGIVSRQLVYQLKKRFISQLSLLLMFFSSIYSPVHLCRETCANEPLCELVERINSSENFPYIFLMKTKSYFMFSKL